MPKIAYTSIDYTQIYKLGPRRGDGAEMAIVRLIDYVKADEKAEKKEKKDAE